MTTTDASDEVGDLCARWRERSLADGWSVPEDWAVPAVVLLARASASGAEYRTHARALGAARAHSGAGISESLRDLAALYAVQGSPTPMDAVLALTRGWEQADGLLDPAVVSAGMSGLSPLDAFDARCADVTHGVRQARSGGRPVVVAVDGRAGMLGRLQRWERDVLLGEAALLSFAPGAPMGYRDGVALALSWTRSAMDPPELADGVDHVRGTLAEWAQVRHGVLRDPARIMCAFAPVHEPNELSALIRRAVL
ncbi:hypothetical protein [Cellulosimicrobium funkei]|uniref:hypothetical protein n=1 Tax=Cellulosimicrobium funkei TaxID=264251 RepID=UPI0036864015